MSRRQKTVFGEYLVEQIREADMSQEEFYKVGYGIEIHGRSCRQYRC